jgi:EmrB/QacA subfamily drug resistance transporter
MAFIDGTVVNLALPALQANFGATLQDVQWVVQAYALFLAALSLVGGSLGDRYGRRLVFCSGVAIFALASVWCGLAPGVGQLIVARAAQGVGAALLMPGSLAIISASFEEERRGRAIGMWSGFTAMIATVKPALGGWLIEHVSWRAVFFINAPLALAALLISFWCVPESQDEEEKNKPLDWLGAGMATLGLGTVVYGLIESTRLGLGHPLVLAALVASALSLAMFLAVEARSRNPMLPLGLFRSRNFSGANLLTFFFYAALGGAMFFLPLNLIQVQGYSATAAGVAWLPFTLVMFLLWRWSGGLAENYGARWPLVVGPVIAAVGYGLFMIPNVGGSFWTTFFPAVATLGLGMALSAAPLTTTVMNAVAETRAGVASGVTNAVSRTAGLLGIAAMNVVFSYAFNHGLERRIEQLNMAPEACRAIAGQRARLAGAELPPSVNDKTRAVLRQAINESFVFGFRVVMAAAAGMALASSMIALIMIEGEAILNRASRSARSPSRYPGRGQALYSSK